MNIIRKSFLSVFLFAVTTGCAFPNDQKESKLPTYLCEQAKYGQLDIEQAQIADPLINTYLLDCAVSVVISEVSLQSGPYKDKSKTKEMKTKIADHFLSQDLDLTYKNDDGDNVLMSVIASFLPEPWKEKAVTALLDKGIDLKEINSNGDTALDIAKYKGNKRIVDLVSF